ncbi:MAG: NAD(P)H-dependent oxidoreductase subunit E [Gammaproteobacteria bacterium]|nr:NAD(P)H-dependent oxidoreductase subunit E [Gammaproteobacteria bacterium]
MSYYQLHLFFCINLRSNNEACCAQLNSEQLFQYCKSRIKQLGLAGQGKVRINKAGCLDRCEWGPVLVVYPSGTWYRYIDETDIDEIIESHLKQGIEVSRLLIPSVPTHAG